MRWYLHLKCIKVIWTQFAMWALRTIINLWRGIGLESQIWNPLSSAWISSYSTQQLAKDMQFRIWFRHDIWFWLQVCFTHNQIVRNDGSDWQTSVKHCFTSPLKQQKHTQQNNAQSGRDSWDLEWIQLFPVGLTSGRLCTSQDAWQHLLTLWERNIQRYI